MLKDIDRNLDDGDIVGISYFPEIFETGKAAVEASRKIPKSSHYSLIAGKRFNCETKHTEYIIRNSWGTETCEVQRKNFRRYPDSETPPEMKKLMDDELMALGGCKATCRHNFSVRDDVGVAALEVQKKLRTCLDRCTKTFHEHNMQINKVPYTCDKADYVVSDDQLAAGIISGNAIR